MNAILTLEELMGIVVQKGVRSSWLEADKKAYENGIPGLCFLSNHLLFAYANHLGLLKGCLHLCLRRMKVRLRFMPRAPLIR